MASSVVALIPRSKIIVPRSKIIAQNGRPHPSVRSRIALAEIPISNSSKSSKAARKRARRIVVAGSVVARRRIGRQFISEGVSS
jgi:hypothetical protein